MWIVILNRCFCSWLWGALSNYLPKTLVINSQANPASCVSGVVNTHGYPFKPDIFQPVGPPNLCAYPSVSGITGKPESSTQVPKRQQRKVWTIQETQVLWECYEKAYSLGQLTSKTSKVNSSGWEVVLKNFNKALNSCSMLPCSLQQIKEKVNNDIKYSSTLTFKDKLKQNFTKSY